MLFYCTDNRINHGICFSNGAGVTLYSMLRHRLQLILLANASLYLTTLTMNRRRGKRDRSIWHIVKKCCLIWNRRNIIMFLACKRRRMGATENTTLPQIRRRPWTNGWRFCVVCCIWTLTVSCVLFVLLTEIPRTQMLFDYRICSSEPHRYIPTFVTCKCNKLTY